MKTIVDNSASRGMPKININKWSNFVFNHPRGNIFQSPEMYKVYQNTKNYNAIIITVCNDNDDILGILLTVIQDENYWLLGKLTKRAIIMGGPIVKDGDPEVLNLILKRYQNEIATNAIFSQYRNFWELSRIEKNIFSNNGFKYDEHLNIIVDLSKTEKELWKNVYPKRRNEIRRAIKEKSKFVIKNSAHDLERCYSILTEVYQRVKIPLPSFQFFLSLMECTTNNIGLMIFCVENEKKIIGCMLALVYKNTIYDYYAGSLIEHYNKYPNDLIPWEVFKWGKNNGFTKFDFGGAGKPNIPYGVREYKKKFGGYFVNYGRYNKVHKKISYSLAKFMFWVWQKIK